MDQAPKSTDQKRTDHNNNNSSSSTPSSACSCSNISIMQLFHEMKQEFPKVPDHTVHQHVTDNCHNRRACIDQLRQAATVNSPTATMYPSKSIHSNQQTPRSPVNGVKWANNQKIKEISEMFENSSSDASSSSDGRLKRPTTLTLRPAPGPPSSTASSSASTPNSTTNLSKLTSTTSSTSSLAASTTSASSISSFNQPTQADQFSNQQFHHNVTLDSSASKYNDSLNVQLNVTVSPISSSAPPIPPRPTRPARHMSQLSVKPEPAYTSLLDPRRTAVGETSASSGTTGQRSYTSVNFTLRQPALILPSPQTPIDIQAGPSSLTYSSSSFDAKQGYQSHLKITVAGNGESCIQAVRTKQPAGIALPPEVSQIDTTINIGGKGTTGSEPIRITTKPHNQPKLPISRLTDGEIELSFVVFKFIYFTFSSDELRQLIQRQMKQKELLEYELHNEREKLEMVRFDIITLTSPMMTRSELQQLCDEISRLRSACERLADEIDVVTARKIKSQLWLFNECSYQHSIPF